MIDTTLAPNPEPTIRDVEQTVQDGLEALRNAPLNEQITAALKFLTPPGYKPIAQLEEDGRKKRSTAAASNWNPETGEIVIYFEPLEPLSAAVTRPVPGRSAGAMSLKIQDMKREVETGMRHDPLLMTPAERSVSSRRAVLNTLGEVVEPLVTDQQIQQLCSALAESEKQGRAFVALTRFRDQELTTHDFGWADSLAHRQAVLAKAIDVGAVVTTQITNPRSPQYPTTTVKLNIDSSYAQSVAPRFQPIQAKGGASASEILLRDRGRF